MLTPRPSYSDARSARGFLGLVLLGGALAGALAACGGSVVSVDDGLPDEDAGTTPTDAGKDATPGDGGTDSGIPADGGIVPTSCTTSTDCRRALGRDNVRCVFELGASCTSGQGKCYVPPPNLPECAADAIEYRPDIMTPDLSCGGDYVAPEGDCHAAPKGYAYTPLRCKGSDASCDVPRPGGACALDAPCGDSRLACGYPTSDVCSTLAGTCVRKDALESCVFLDGCGCDGFLVSSLGCVKNLGVTWLDGPTNGLRCGIAAQPD